MSAETPAAVVRDEETIALVADFLQESTDGLAAVDGILLEIDQGGADAEKVNALFRTFHTIKGVSAFFDAADVTRLAHATEAVLDRARTGQARLEGKSLELVFEATGRMRGLLGGLRIAVEAGVAFSQGTVHDIVALLEAVLRDEPSAPDPDEPPPPVVEAAETHAADPAPVAGSKVRETVKVDLERVDAMVELIGELIIVESMVAGAPELAGHTSTRLHNALSQLGKISRDLQGMSMRMRMVPVRGVFLKMARMVRDLGRKTGKPVQLVAVGETTEMDRSMVERIEDPLVHMIRNAIDHAIETPAERAAAGKPAMGTVRLAASHEGGSIAIEVSDDGRGLQRAAIVAKAQQRGLLRDDTDALTDSEVFSLIFHPGFSTAAKVTEISGRGVGMDVVKRNVESMRGRIAIRSTPGEGTTFKVLLPLTLAVIDGLLVSCAGERYVLPSLTVVESLEPQAGMVHALGDDAEVIRVRDRLMPLLRLGRLLDPSAPVRPAEDGLVVIVEALGRCVALLVDDVLTQQQVVIKSLGEGLGSADWLAGAAILSDGLVGLILNVDRICASATPTAARALMEAA